MMNNNKKIDTIFKISKLATRLRIALSAPIFKSLFLILKSTYFKTIPKDFLKILTPLHYEDFILEITITNLTI